MALAAVLGLAAGGARWGSAVVLAAEVSGIEGDAPSGYGPPTALVRLVASQLLPVVLAAIALGAGGWLLAGWVRRRGASGTAAVSGWVFVLAILFAASFGVARPALAVAGVVTIVLAWIASRRRAWVARVLLALLAAAGLVGVLPFAPIVAVGLRQLAPWLVPPAVLLALWVARSRKRPGWETRRRWLGRGGALVALPALFVLGLNAGYHWAPVDCARIRADPRIRPLLTSCEVDFAEWTARVSAFPTCAREDGPPPFPPRAIFPSADRRSVYCAFGFLEYPCPTAVVKLDRETRAAEHVIWSYAPYRGVCPAGSGRCLVTSWQMRNVLVVDDEHDRLALDLKLDEYGPSYLAEDRVHGRVLVPSPHVGAFPDTTAELLGLSLGAPQARLPAEDLLAAGGRGDDLLLVYDVATAAFETVPLRPDPDRGGLTGNPAFVAYEPTTGRLAIGNGVPRAGLVYARGALDQLEVEPLDLWSFLRSAGIAHGEVYDLAAREAYTSLSAPGWLRVSRLDTGEVLRTVPVARGLREVELDPVRRVLFASAYLSGEIHVFDLATQRVVDTLYVGPNIRQLAFEPDLDLLLVASKAGFFEVRWRGPLLDTPGTRARE